MLFHIKEIPQKVKTEFQIHFPASYWLITTNERRYKEIDKQYITCGEEMGKAEAV